MGAFRILLSIIAEFIADSASRIATMGSAVVLTPMVVAAVIMQILML